MTDGQTDGRRRLQYPHRFLKKRGDNKIVSIQTMSNPKILCLPPIANTLRDQAMRFTWMLFNEGEQLGIIG